VVWPQVANLRQSGETKIQTNTDEKQIRDIEIGDTVKSYSHKLKKLVGNRVKKLFKRTANALTKVAVAGSVLMATPEHQVFANSAYQEIQNLESGDTLYDFKGGLHLVESVETFDTTLTVYNFEVENAHNYYAGELGLLVHNDCYLDDVRKAVDGLADAKSVKFNAFKSKLDELFATNRSLQQKLTKKLSDEFTVGKLSADDLKKFMADFCSSDDLAKFAENAELVDSWKVFSKINVDETIYNNLNNELECIGAYLSRFKKSADDVVEDIRLAGSYTTWVRRNLFDLIDESDDLGGLFVDVVENSTDKISINTKINSSVGGTSGEFCSSYVSAESKMVLKTALNAEGVITVKVGGVDIGINYYNVVRHMKKMGVPKDGLRKLTHSEVVNKETVMFFHKTIKEVGASSTITVSKATKDIVIKCPLVRLDNIMLKQMGYEVTGARISGNGRFIEADLYIESKFVDMTEEDLIKLGVDIDEDEIFHMFDVEVDITKVTE